MALNKAKIIQNINEELGITQKRNPELVEQIIEAIKSTMASGDGVLISGFGKFCVNEKKELKSRNPAVGDSMMLRPRRMAKFKVSGKLRMKINKN